MYVCMYIVSSVRDFHLGKRGMRDAQEREKKGKRDSEKKGREFNLHCIPKVHLHCSIRRDLEKEI